MIGKHLDCLSDAPRPGSLDCSSRTDDESLCHKTHTPQIKGSCWIKSSSGGVFVVKVSLDNILLAPL
eukprot:3017639-Amphidinium_carterae.1